MVDFGYRSIVENAFKDDVRLNLCVKVRVNIEVRPSVDVRVIVEEYALSF